MSTKDYKIYDEKTGAELSSPDLENGYTYSGRRLKEHHPAQNEVTHREILPGTEQLNGGKGLSHIVIDQPAKDAWDEYENCYYYHAYTDEEKSQMAPYVAEVNWDEMAEAYKKGVNEA